MKKLVIMLTALITMTVSANAMSYEQARQQALFLTDKMAYELDLTEDQYEAAYEINLDYLMSVNSYDDLYGAYWTHRNLDLSYVLFDWQYAAYCAASYFYRPLYWEGGYWHFGIYARYPHRTYLYFGRPHFWVSYRGGHSWHNNGGRSWYHGRTFGPSHKPSREHHVGMRSTHRPEGRGNHSINRGGNDRHDRNHNGNNSGLNRNGRDNNRNHNIGNNGSHNRENNNNRTFGNDTYQHNGNNHNGSRNFSTRESSTRTTVTSPNTSDRPSRGFGMGSRSGSSTNSSSSTPSRSFRPSNSDNSGSSFGTRSSHNSGSRSFGNSSNSNRSFGSSTSGGSRSSFGGSHSSGSRSFGSSSNSGSRSFGSSSNSGSRGFGGGSRSGGGSGGGHGHFGGRR